MIRDRKRQTTLLMKLSIYKIVIFICLTSVPGLCSADADKNQAAWDMIAEKDIFLSFENLINHANERDQDIAKLFIDVGYLDQLRDYQKEELLFHAAKNGSTILLEWLINDDPEKLNKAYNDAFPLLYLSVQGGHYETSKFLLDKGVKPNLATKLGDTPVYMAIVNDDKKLVNLLLDYGADINGPDASGSSPLRTASAQENLKIVDLLIKRGADVNYPKGMPLLIAAIRGNTEIIRLLIENGADVNIRGIWHGCLPLHYVVRMRRIELVELLVNAASEINVSCRGEGSPLDWAKSVDNNLEVINYLKKNGAISHLHQYTDDISKRIFKK